MKENHLVMSPIMVNRMTIKNRVVMPPMGTNFANADGTMNNDHIHYYELRAKGGVGMIILENACIDFPLGTNGTTQLRIDNDQYIPSLYRFNEVMHKYDTRTCVQINHAGASAYGLRLNGETPVSASNVPSKTGGPTPRPLEVAEIHEIVKRYGEAAHRAQRAGFDCVEIHAGHSYLISQFMSPLYNRREDEFGGSAKNRARFAKMVIEEVREKVGPFFPISIRFSADEFLEGGNTLEDTLELVSYFVDKVDMLNVSAALNDSIEYQIDQMNLSDGWRSYLAKAFKEKFNKVVMCSGNIRSPHVANSIIQNEEADLIGMGRGLIAEPEWVNKVKNDQIHLLRKCISCNIGCADHRIAKSKPMRCTVNPDVIFGEAYRNHKISKPIKMVVIGGGTTALEAACSAAEVGVDVVLFESKSYLGGLAHEIARLPDKKRIDDFVYYLEQRAKQLTNLDIRLNTVANMNNIAFEKPDIILNASGALPMLPPIPGLQEAMSMPCTKVFSIFDLLNDMSSFQDIIGKKIAVIGGGAVGLDVVEYFSERKAHPVSIVEMQSELGKDLDMITKVSMNKLIHKNKVQSYVSTTLLEVKPDKFKVKRNDEIFEIDFEYGFVCLGMKANGPLMDDLYNYQIDNDVEIVNYGDSKLARRIFEGVNEARGILKVIEYVEYKRSIKGE